MMNNLAGTFIFLGRIWIRSHVKRIRSRSQIDRIANTALLYEHNLIFRKKEHHAVDMLKIPASYRRTIMLKVSLIFWQQVEENDIRM